VIDARRALLFTENDRIDASPRRSRDRAVRQGRLPRALVHGARSGEPGPGRHQGCRRIVTCGPAGGTIVVRLRCGVPSAGPLRAEPFADFDSRDGERQREADEFYARSIPGSWRGRALVQRQAWPACSGAKQFYHYDVDRG
jgi:hypothetical protein